MCEKKVLKLAVLRTLTCISVLTCFCLVFIVCDFGFVAVSAPVAVIVAMVLLLLLLLLPALLGRCGRLWFLLLFLLRLSSKLLCRCCCLKDYGKTQKTAEKLYKIMEKL